MKLATIAEAQQHKRDQGLALMRLQAFQNVERAKSPRTHIQRMYIELAKEGLLKNEPWVQDNSIAGIEMFELEETLSLFAGAVCCLNEYALDYLKQCPALLVAMFPERFDYHAVRMATCRAARDHIEQGLKLKELCQLYNVSHLLRKLSAYNLRSDDFFVLRKLSAIYPSTLAQLFPEQEFQREWLRLLRAWVRTTDAQFLWAATQLKHAIESDIFTPDSTVNHVVIDFVSGQPNIYLGRWDRVVEAAQEWHDEVMRQEAEMANCLDVELDHAVTGRITRDKPNLEETWFGEANYEPFPDVYEVPGEGCVIVALKTKVSLEAESNVMGHCVGWGTARMGVPYWKRVRQGSSLIFSLRRVFESGPSATLATFELGRTRSRNFYIVQTAGPRNKEISVRAKSLIEQYVNRGNTYGGFNVE